MQRGEREIHRKNAIERMLEPNPMQLENEK